MTYIILRCPHCLEPNLYEKQTENISCIDCGELIETNLTQ